MKRLLLACVLLGGCEIFGLDKGVVDDLEDQRSEWLKQGIDDYSYEFVRACFCPPSDTLVITVVNNAVASVVSKTTGAPAGATESRTMTQLYDYLIDVAEDADEMHVSFDGRWHIPIDVSVDLYKNAVDDEFAISILNFQRVN